MLIQIYWFPVLMQTYLFTKSMDAYEQSLKKVKEKFISSFS